MDIVLNKEDIEKLVKNSYSGVNNVSFNVKSLKVTLDVDIEKFANSQKEYQKQEQKQEKKTRRIT